MIERTQLLNDLNELLDVERIEDYCPNGLQVAGNSTIKRLVTGVTASQALIDAAIEYKADALLVHHGYFWKGESAPLTGIKGERITHLIKNNINLIAYHLPLDIHPEYGNNALLAKALEITDNNLDSRNLLRFGSIKKQKIGDFIATISRTLNRTPLHLEGGPEEITSIAWCTGAAQDMIEDAQMLGADVFISGEVSERTTHIARESGIHYLCCGHHATETFGVRALGEKIADKYAIDVRFINIPNPV